VDVPEVLRASVVGVVSPDEQVRMTVEVLLEVEFGLTVRTAPDIASLMVALAPDEALIVIVAQIDGVDTGGVPVIHIPKLPIDARQVLTAIRSVLGAKSEARD
jgi:hypothetical protein